MTENGLEIQTKLSKRIDQPSQYLRFLFAYASNGTFAIALHLRNNSCFSLFLAIYNANVATI